MSKNICDPWDYNHGVHYLVSPISLADLIIYVRDNFPDIDHHDIAIDSEGYTETGAVILIFKKK